MVETKTHTPGPWTYEPGDIGDPSVGMAATAPTVFCGNPNGEDDGVLLATLHAPIYQNSEEGEPLYWGNAEANARLIAAAPDLLAACKLFVEGPEARFISGYRSAQAAIALAEGR